MINENEIAKEIEDAMELKPHNPQGLPKASNLPTGLPYTTHASRVDQLIEEMRMTIRILEEARKRF